MSEALTRETFQRFVSKMMEPRPYVPHTHMVSPASMARGWGLCVECGQIVGEIPPDVKANYIAALDRLFDNQGGNDGEG